MKLEIAKILCSKQSPSDSWGYMVSHPQSFIWSDDEDPIGTWNLQFGQAFGAVNDEPILGGKGSQRLSYRDRIVEVQLEFERDDRLRLLHGLAKITRPESDLRLCLGSTHSSDVAFIAMSSADWKTLESQLDAETVALHFLSLDSPFDEFMEAGFGILDVPQSRLAPEMTDWEGGSSYRPDKLDYTIVSDGPGQPRLEALHALVRQYLEAGIVTVSFCQTPSKLHVDRNEFVDEITDHLGNLQIRVSNSTCTGFVVIEPNGVAAGWRTDGWQPVADASAPAPGPTKWWQFGIRRKK